MLLEEYSTCLTAFRSAFGDEAERPGWNQVRTLDAATVLQAIREIATDPLTHLTARRCIAVACSPGAGS